MSDIDPTMPKEKTKKIAFFMDFDNMLAGNKLDDEIFVGLNEKLLAIGVIEYAGIYTDVRNITTAGNSSYALLVQAYLQGFKTIHCPKLNGSEKPKDTVDENLAHDVYDLLEKRPDIDVFVFATHDRNFLPVINRVRQRQKTIILVINSPSGSKSLQQVAHQTIKLNLQAEKPLMQTIPADLKAFLEESYESPSQLIELIETAGLLKCRDIKIAFDLIVAIESMKPGKYGFRYYMDWLGNEARFPLSKHEFDDDVIKGILSILIDQRVLTKYTEEHRTYYVLNRTHPLFQAATNPGNYEKLKVLFQD